MTDLQLYLLLVPLALLGLGAVALWCVSKLSDNSHARYLHK